MMSCSYYFKRFFRNPVLAIATGIFFAVSFGFVLYCHLLEQYKEPLYFLDITLKLSLFSFIFFMLLAYEFLYKAEQYHFQERLKALNKGPLKYSVSSGVTVFLLVAAYASMFLIENIIVYSLLQVNRTAYFISYHLEYPSQLSCCAIGGGFNWQRGRVR